MYETEYPFMFDTNFSFGDDSVFTVIDNEYSNITPVPPVSGYFLQLEGSPFELLDGEFMTLL